jgi:hypothetical protein
MSRALRRLIQGLHPHEPSKEHIFYVFMYALQLLPFTAKEIHLLITAFEISFEGHRLAPRRKSGEIYFIHVLRQVIRAVLLMKKHHVASMTLLAAIVLHDTVEDAEAGHSTRFLAKSQIHLRINNARIEYAVMCMTKKKKDGESRQKFLQRIISADVWEVLVAKPFDGNDNIMTLAAMPFEKQYEKVEEIFEYYPHIEKRAIHLISLAGEKGELLHYKRWIRLVQETHRILRKNAWRESKRIQKVRDDKVA